MVGVDAGVRTMMAAIGYGVTSCLCVFFGAWGQHKKLGREQKHECIVEDICRLVLAIFLFWRAAYDQDTASVAKPPLPKD
jgi:hypothetical protein